MYCDGKQNWQGKDGDGLNQFCNIQNSLSMVSSKAQVLGLKPESGQVSTSLADHFGLATGQIDHGGGFQRAGSRVNHASHLVLVALADILGIVQRFSFTIRNQGSGKQWRAMQREQVLKYLVVWYAQSDSLA